MDILAGIEELVPPSGPVVTRALAEEDLLSLGRGTSTAPTVREMRETHHQLARLVARGLKGVEVCAIMGFSQSRLSILQSDPAFRELVAHYREVEQSAFADAAGQVAAFGMDVLGELRDRLELQPESFKNRELLEVLDSMLDRSGLGRSTKVQAEVLHVTGEQLMKLKQLAKERNNALANNHADAAAAGTQEGSGTPSSVVLFPRAMEGRKEVEGLPREGDDL